ncbi:MAG: glycosyltransferase family 2 protein [Bacteroidales bacterium]|nr:glycosyltransferase family 2 protein [Bacteroidales bacterium]
MNEPLVSVVIPCHNHGRFLAQAIDSVFAQTYSNVECVVVDDGSDDNTCEVANQYASRPHFVFIHKPEVGGVAKARNSAIQASAGSYILSLDADDYILPTFVEKAMGWFLAHPSTKLVYSKVQTFGESEGPLGLDEYDYRKFIFNNCIPATALFRREDYDQTHGYNPNMQHGLEDWDFFLSLLEEGDEVHCIDECLFCYRQVYGSRNSNIVLFERDLYRQLYHNHSELYDKYLATLEGDRLLFAVSHAPLYEQATQESRRLNDELKAIRSSRAYRLGKALLRPIKVFKEKWYR